MQNLRQLQCLPPTIVMTGNASVNTAVRAMQLGARDFLIQPFAPSRLLDAIALALGEPAESDAAATMPANLAGTTQDNVAPEDVMPLQAVIEPVRYGFIGESPAMLRVFDQIAHAARSNATVFITGESGTGKEVCAEGIHRAGARRDKPFIPINCAAIPRDLMESELFGHVKGAFTGAIQDREGAASLADGGTLFLDEIAEMTPDMQTKLLRFLQDFVVLKVGGSKPEKTNVRIICATNRHPLAEINAGRFREDLFYRLHVVPIDMPPLHAREDDIVMLASAMLARYGGEEGKRFDGFSADAESVLRHYRWPGNVRQLQNVVRHIAVMRAGGMITASMLPETLLHDDRRRTVEDAPVLTHADRPIRPLADIEREVIEHAIALYGGNVARAASALRISPSTIYRKKMGWDDANGDVREQVAAR